MIKYVYPNETFDLHDLAYLTFESYIFFEHLFIFKSDVIHQKRAFQLVDPFVGSDKSAWLPHAVVIIGCVERITPCHSFPNDTQGCRCK